MCIAPAQAIKPLISSKNGCAFVCMVRFPQNYNEWHQLPSSLTSFSVILPAIYLAAESAVTCVWGLWNNLTSLPVVWIFPRLSGVTKNEYWEVRGNFRCFLEGCPGSKEESFQLKTCCSKEDQLNRGLWRAPFIP